MYSFVFSFLTDFLISDRNPTFPDSTVGWCSNWSHVKPPLEIFQDYLDIIASQHHHCQPCMRNSLLHGVTPGIFGRAAHEIRERFTNAKDITATSTADLVYLKACIEKGLRMYPPVVGTTPRVVPDGGATICGRFASGKVSCASSSLVYV
jgi:hypothetical protein